MESIVLFVVNGYEIPIQWAFSVGVETNFIHYGHYKLRGTLVRVVEIFFLSRIAIEDTYFIMIRFAGILGRNQ